MFCPLKSIWIGVFLALSLIFLNLSQGSSLRNLRQASNVAPPQDVYKRQEFGEEGLMRSRQNKKYTFQFKLSMVELYLSSEVSDQELALSLSLIHI